MIIKHLYHSGFLIELDNYTIIFDCISNINYNLSSKKKILVFISHSHSDHFNKNILDLDKNYNVQFIISNDIELDNINMPNIHVMENYESIVLNDIPISSYGTTDLGNSYLVEIDNITFFHSGDLNWWHWKKMKNKQLIHEENIYKKEINILKGNTIDYAFVPVDPRLEEFSLLAVDYFVETINPKYIIPMHAFGDYSINSKLIDRYEKKGTKLINVKHENQILVRR